MRVLRTFLAIVLAAAAMMAQETRTGAANEPSELPKLEHYSVQMADKSVDPCKDFYKYACGKWMAANPIPADEGWWSPDSTVKLWNEGVLRETLEKAELPSAGRSANEQKIGDYYAACMNQKGVDEQTAEVLKPELAPIAALKDKKQLAGEVAHLHRTVRGAWIQSENQTAAPMLGFSGLPDFADVSHNVAFVDQGGMGLPGRDFYLKDDDKSRDIRAKYLAHVAKMLTLAGEPEKQAQADAKLVLAMETEMAQGAMDVVLRRDPKNLNHPMTLEQVKQLTPAFDWDAYLKAVEAPASKKYIVTSPDFLRALNRMLERRPLQAWKVYLRWHMLHGSAPYLSEPFEKENFDFYDHTLYGAGTMQPRWRRCVRSTDKALGEALGQAYVARALPPESKARVLEMVKHIEAEMGKDIQAQDWMAAETKKQALTKLAAVINKVAYPDKWRDYSSVTIVRTSYLGNVHATTEFEFERWVQKVGKPLDRTEWDMTPATFNAYEDPQTNTINFPAGILQPPLFDAGQDEALNYAGEGWLIGHELIHGFDDQGRKFDAAGNLHDWWTEADAKAYVERGKCISDEYTQMVPEAGVKQNGLLTQGEDTADNGGAHLAYLALQDDLAQKGQSLEDKGAEGFGFTRAQEFFIAYGDSWCTNERPELTRTLVLTDPHSMPKYRVNNVVANMPEFWRAFGCRKGQAMVRENACRIW